MEKLVHGPPSGMLSSPLFVSGLSFTASNYEKAFAIIKERFGNK